MGHTGETQMCPLSQGLDEPSVLFCFYPALQVPWAFLLLPGKHIGNTLAEALPKKIVESQCSTISKHTAKLFHNLDLTRAQKSPLSKSCAHVSTVAPHGFLVDVAQAAVLGIHLSDT